MTAPGLYRESIVIDGLEICNWSRDVFEDMRRGGLTAVNCTCSVWEGIRGSLDKIAEWKRWFRENDDLILQVYSTADIRRAKAEGKTGIYLGWQNSWGIEDRIDYLELFHDLGVRAIQLTYNTRNLVGTGCWESTDAGLSDFGREVVDEMNRLGILVDLSHVGPATSRDAILHSRQPVAYTHCAPAGLFEHPRNKTDDELTFIADNGGFVGFASYPPFMAQQDAATVDDCVATLEYLIDRAGEDRVGMGTDFTQDQDAGFFDYLSMDKGYARRLVPRRPGGVVTMPDGLRRIGDFPNLAVAMEKRGWPEARIRKVLGENWLRFLEEVWRA